MINYYVVLEIPNFSDETVIKKAYRTLSKKYHPDVNNDPRATDYFQKINEAYSFLMNENKRFLLNQFLKTVGNRPYQSSKKKEDVHFYQAPSKPVIHFFTTDRKTFTLGDYILVQWNVSQCRSVHLNILGAVDFSGTHYLRVEQFIDEIIILMTITGLDHKEYKYRIRLKYFNENPTIKAFHQVFAKNPKTKAIHFKQEQFFDTHSRISKNSFQNRMILLLTILSINCFFYSLATYKHFMFILLCFNFWLIYVQCYKRIHDIKHLKYDAHTLWIPLYDLLVFKKLFTEESEKEPNEFGVVPSQKKISFKSWAVNGLKTQAKQLSLIKKISMGMFFVVLFAITIKSFWRYEEYPVSLTSKYIESSRPTKGGHVYKDYFLVFDNRFTIEVTDIQFSNILKDQKNSTFVMGVDRKGVVQYINVVNNQSEVKKRLNLGILNNANPALLIMILLFLAQIYVWKHLNKPDEKPYANGFMIIALVVYLYIFWLTIK